jgi:hypothetical protein
VIAKEVASREFSVFVGAEPDPPWKQVASREVSIVVPDGTVPAPVTDVNRRDSVDSFSALDLDWTAYNEVGQKDVVRYRVYLGPTYFDDVTALSPFMYVPAETKRCTVTGLVPYGVYYVAIVAEDVLGQFNRAVRSQSAQASVDRVKEVRGLAANCGTNWLTFTWQPPEGADPGSNNLLVAYLVYLAGASTPVVLDRWATSYTATNLLAGHGYPVVIRTLDNSNRVSDGATLLAATLVPNPSQTVAHTFYGTTRVSWEELQPAEVIDRFYVFMAETNFTSVAGMTPVASTRGHSADFSLVVDKTYWFAVTSQNIGGCPSTGLPVRVIAHTPGGTNVPIVLQPGAYDSGVFTIIADGPLGADYVLLESPDLRDWTRVSTNTPAVLPFSVTVTNVPGLNRFYRVLIQ